MGTYIKRQKNIFEENHFIIILLIFVYIYGNIVFILIFRFKSVQHLKNKFYNHLFGYNSICLEAYNNEIKYIIYFHSQKLFKESKKKKDK